MPVHLAVFQSRFLIHRQVVVSFVVMLVVLLAETFVLAFGQRVVVLRQAQELLVGRRLPVVCWLVVVQCVVADLFLMLHWFDPEPLLHSLSAINMSHHWRRRGVYYTFQV